jgi:hypothetical protein
MRNYSVNDGRRKNRSLGFAETVTGTAITTSTAGTAEQKREQKPQ